MRLDNAVRAWGTPNFETVLKQEVAQSSGELPLQQGLTAGSYVLDEPVTVVINHVEEAGGTLSVQAGIFYKSMITGCSCEGDPTPTPENDEYCEVQLDIDKATAAAAVKLLPD